MGKLDQIKAKQVAHQAAIDAGEEPPEVEVVASKPVSQMRVNKLDQIKAKQQKTKKKEPATVTPALKQQGKIPTLPIAQTALAVDLGKLKEVKDLDEKCKIKRTVLPTYLPYVNHYVKAGEKHPNDVAVQVMIWQFDVDDIEDAVNLALHLIEQGVHQMPERFKRRDLETFVCDAMYDWANNLLKNTEHGASPYLDVLVDTLRKDKWSLAPMVESKCYVMLAKHKVRAGDDVKALELCHWAEEANPEGAGVNTLKKKIQKRLEKLAKEKTE